MDVKVAVAWYLNKKRKRPSQRRRYWVHPLLAQRALVGAFVTLYSHLREDETKFYDYFRMSINSFDELLEKSKAKLEVSNFRRNPISPAERLAVTVRYLSSGDSFSDLHSTYRLGISTIAIIVRQVCIVICDLLKHEYLPEPTIARWKQISKEFEKRCNFPNCIGALDSKRIRVIKPTKTEFTKCKQFVNVHLTALCDTNFCFTFIDVTAYERGSGPNAIKENAFWKKLEKPPPKALPGTYTQAMPYIMVASESFDLANNVLRPYAKKNANEKKRLFNELHARARRFVECSFGILSNKWRIFHRPLNVDLDLAVSIVRTCCLLHNFITTKEGYNFEDTLTVVGFEDYEAVSTLRKSHLIIRDNFADYFVSITEGE